MVRLQQLSEPKYGQVIQSAQFHYGSITTFDETQVKKILNESQFHYGSITTTDSQYLINVLAKSSIPLWFDYNFQT